jgi:hypothetical protein
MHKSVHFLSSWSLVHTRELITTLPSKSASIHSVVSILPICRNIVHFYLLYLWAEVVLASLDHASPIRTGAGEVVGMVPMGKTDNASSFA